MKPHNLKMSTEPMTPPKLVIERLRDWSWGAFLNETDASCIAIGDTEEEARANGEHLIETVATFKLEWSLRELFMKANKCSEAAIAQHRKEMLQRYSLVEAMVKYDE